MTSSKPNTKEQLVYYLLQNISLGTYDNRFLTNLQSIYIQDKKPTTSNQSDLLNKITLRYAKQLRRNEIDAAEMVELPWALAPIVSLPEYTNAFVTIEDDLVTLRSPYKKEFITEFKASSIHLTWEKETKTWSAPFCESTLKHFVHCTDKHYQDVVYCDRSKEIINSLVEYETAKYWDPELIITNNNLYIAACNPHLHEATKHIPLTLDVRTISRLLGFGIKISDQVVKELYKSILDEDAVDQVAFALSDKPVMDIHDMKKVAKYINLLGSDFVILAESYSINNLTLLKHELTQYEIPHVVIDRRSDLSAIKITDYEFPVMVTSSMWSSTGQTRLRHYSGKVISLANNKPIPIK